MWTPQDTQTHRLDYNLNEALDNTNSNGENARGVNKPFRISCSKFAVGTTIRNTTPGILWSLYSNTWCKHTWCQTIHHTSIKLLAEDCLFVSIRKLQINIKLSSIYNLIHRRSSNCCSNYYGKLLLSAVAAALARNLHTKSRSSNTKLSNALNPLACRIHTSNEYLLSLRATNMRI